ncbi:MAG: hypothetical protein O3C40_09965 [Planctomycetota bacterium]|nr:hypothetical protein [Planctomycetota bacterium]
MTQQLSPHARRAALKQLMARVFQPLEADISILDAGYLFRGYLDDYASGVFVLLDIIDELDMAQLAKLAESQNAKDVNQDLKPTLRRLCELSREVTFSIDPSRLPPDLRSSIEKLFRFAVEQVPPVADPEVNGYLRNMRNRMLQPIAVV